MELKLKSILEGIPWSLAVKAVVIAAAWWVSWWLYAAVLIWWFYQGTRDPELSYGATLVALLLVGAFITLLPGGGWVWLIFVAVTSGLVIGLRHLRVLRKNLGYRILHISVAAAALLTFFWMSVFAGRIFQAWAFLVIVVGCLGWDLAKVAVGKQQVRFIAILSTILTLQAVWVVGLLPIEFVNKTAMGVLIILVGQEYLIKSEKKIRNRQNFNLTLVTVFTMAAVIIFWISKWSVL